VKKLCVIFDLDGTVCDNSHRLHLLDKPKDWARYLDACPQDREHQAAVIIWKALLKYGPETQIVVMTGRCETHRPQTRAWLTTRGLYYDMMVMRPEGDYRPDFEMKAELLKQIQEYYEVLCVFDDSPAVVKMLRDKGIVVFAADDTAWKKEG